MTTKPHQRQTGHFHRWNSFSLPLIHEFHTYKPTLSSGNIDLSNGGRINAIAHSHPRHIIVMQLIDIDQHSMLHGGLLS